MRHYCGHCDAQERDRLIRPMVANVRRFGRTTRAVVLAAISLLGMPLATMEGQERPAQRVASIVSVAVAEYALGVDETGAPETFIPEMEEEPGADAPARPERDGG